MKIPFYNKGVTEFCRRCNKNIPEELFPTHLEVFHPDNEDFKVFSQYFTKLFEEWILTNKHILFLKVGKSGKQSFLKLHCPKRDRKFWRISALASKMGQIRKLTHINICILKFVQVMVCLHIFPIFSWKHQKNMQADHNLNGL